jgi:hypothetical protein
MYRGAEMDEHVVSTIREYLAGHDAIQIAIFGSYTGGRLDLAAISMSS